MKLNRKDLKKYAPHGACLGEEQRFATKERRQSNRLRRDIDRRASRKRIGRMIDDHVRELESGE